MDGYLVDVVRGDLLIEIQTRNFSAIRDKLQTLVEHHPVRLVHPIALEKWIVRLPSLEAKGSRRKSPRRGKPEDLFYELVRLPSLIDHPNFSLEVVFTREEEIRQDDGKGSWRRKGWSIADRRLLEVVEQRPFRSPADFAAFIPAALPQPFTTRELAKGLRVPLNLSYKIIYCLKTMRLIEPQGRRKRSVLYAPTFLRA